MIYSGNAIKVAATLAGNEGKNPSPVESQFYDL